MNRTEPNTKHITERETDEEDLSGRAERSCVPTVFQGLERDEDTDTFLSFPIPTTGENSRKRGIVHCTIQSTSKPPIRRRSGWGEMFFRRKNISAHPLRAPAEAQRSGFGGKEAEQRNE